MSIQCNNLSTGILTLTTWSVRYLCSILDAVRILAYDKEPGVRPICCGEMWLRLVYNAAIDGEAKTLARRACGNVQLCAGLQAGIEGNLHALKESWSESGGWTFDAGNAGQPTPKTIQTLQMKNPDTFPVYSKRLEYAGNMSQLANSTLEVG